jgi:hypothetical protein
MSNEDDSEETGHREFYNVFVVVIVLVNALALRAAWGDGSWGAIGVAFYYGPLANAALALLGSFAYIPLRGRTPITLSSHLALTIGVPLAAVVVDIVAIGFMNLQGC